jgi:hypothetical protein
MRKVQMCNVHLDNAQIDNAQIDNASSQRVALDGYFFHMSKRLENFLWRNRL